MKFATIRRKKSLTDRLCIVGVWLAWAYIVGGAVYVTVWNIK